jgi:hypothetical protein
MIVRRAKMLIIRREWKIVVGVLTRRVTGRRFEVIGGFHTGASSIGSVLLVNESPTCSSLFSMVSYASTISSFRKAKQHIIEQILKAMYPIKLLSFVSLSPRNDSLYMTPSRFNTGKISNNPEDSNENLMVTDITNSKREPMISSVWTRRQYFLGFGVSGS